MMNPIQSIVFKQLQRCRLCFMASLVMKMAAKGEKCAAGAKEEQ